MGNIVIVEDETNIRNNISEILELEGKKGLAFASPKDFIDYVKTEGTGQIDLIISDIMMPVMTGIEMIKTVSKIHSLKEVPVIYLTALGDDSTISGAYETSDCTLTVDYVMKPFHMTWFIAKIKTMTSLKQKNEQLQKAHNDILVTNMEIKNILDTVDSENFYLAERLKSLLSRKNPGIEKKLDVVKDLIPKIAVNDLASLKFVANIIEKNQKIIDRIAREPDEEDEFFKILPKTAEPLRTAIWDIEQTIRLFISLGIIDEKSIDAIPFEETSFYEILYNDYKNGGFSTEQFNSFINDTRFKTNRVLDNTDVILF